MIKIRRKIIDVHAHIIPGVDDGSGSMEESCRMLEQAAKQGVIAVVATPHYSRRRGTGEYARLLEQLQEQVRKNVPDMKLYLGQELYYHEEIPEQLQEGRALTLNGGRYVLVEFQPEVTYQTLFRGVRRLVSAGYRPVLAHMERYVCLRQEKNLEDMAGSGCVFQMNYESLEGNLLQRDTRWCRKQVRLGRIQLLGTDMHRVDYRPPKIDGAWKWLETHIDQEELEGMVYRNPMHLIKDEKIS